MTNLHRDQESVAPRHIKTAFVSDVHLGSRYCHADRFLSFLQRHTFDEIYLVGDVIDGWRLRRSWRWPAIYHRIFHRLLALHVQGTKLFYTPGNHDEFLRHYLRDFGFIHIADEFVHAAEDGRSFLIMHGDKFDEVEKTCKWLSVIGASLYEFLMWSNFVVNCGRHLYGLRDCHFSGRAKMKFKRAVNFISDFESKIAEHSRRRGCQGVICGHIHAPTMQQIGDITYCNTGDWVEHCTALVEHIDGTWEMLKYLSASPASGYVESDEALELSPQIARKSRAPWRQCDSERESVTTTV